MVDLHTHLLPGLDDGAKTQEESARLLQSALDQSITRIAFTPHYYGKERSVARFLEMRAQAYQSIRARIAPDTEIRSGAEVYLDTVVAAESLVRLRIEDTRYILIELPYESPWPTRLWTRLDKLSRLGVIPVVAHAERYAPVRKRPGEVSKLIERGCLIQLNADSVVNRDRLTLKIIEHGQCHIVASDAHDGTRRPIRLAEAYAQISSIFDEATAGRLQANAEAVWSNRSVDTAGYTPVKKIFGSYR